jgi:hypothetical protein
MENGKSDERPKDDSSNEGVHARAFRPYASSDFVTASSLQKYVEVLKN